MSEPAAPLAKRLISLVFLLCFLGGAAAVADDDPRRDVHCVSQRIGVTDAQFRTCFRPVRPDPGHHPDGRRQRENKAKLLPCLQKANPRLTNDALDRAMDACRPEGPMRR